MSNFTDSNAGDEEMTDSQIYDILSRLGEIEGTLRTFMQTWRDQDTAAGLGRRVVQEKLELQSHQIARLAIDVQNVQQDVAELRNEVEDKVMPAVDTIEAERHRKTGAKSVWAIIGAAIVMGMSAMAYIVDKVLAIFIHKP